MKFIFRKLDKGTYVASHNKFRFKRLILTRIPIKIRFATLDLKELNLPPGTYKIQATSVAKGLNESDKSTTVTFTVNN